MWVGGRVSVGGGGRIGSVAVGRGVVGMGVKVRVGWAARKPLLTHSPRMARTTKPAPIARRTIARISVHRRDVSGT